MATDKVGVTINRIILDNISIKDLNELETSIVAKQVESRLKEIESETGVVDTLKLSLLTAMSFAAELYVRQQTHDSDRQVGTKSVDEMISRLEAALGHAPSSK
ncbi:MAG: cell division protein ZapA [Elusimicrobiales bacterium]|nr:cell division protein ZapA [Elusimicrobiales bacterium]